MKEGASSSERFSGGVVCVKGRDGDEKRVNRRVVLRSRALAGKRDGTRRRGAWIRKRLMRPRKGKSLRRGKKKIETYVTWHVCILLISIRLEFDLEALLMLEGHVATVSTRLP